MRVDTTVVETNIHYPTDSTLLGDGVRVLTRIMKKITKIAGAAGTKLRDRSRSVKLRLLEIARVARAKGPINQDRLQQRYRQLLDATSRVVGQAKHFSAEIAQGVKRSTNAIAAIGAGRPASGTRCDDAARQAGDEADQGSHLPRQHAQLKASSSACSSPRPKSFARAKPESPTSSARW